MATIATQEKPRETIKYIEVERKVVHPEKFNVWASAPKSEWQYATIPKEDLHGYPYPEVMINHDKFDADHNSYVGEDETERKFFVPPILAGEIKRICDRFHLESLSLLQPRKRMEALRQLNRAPGSTRVAASAGPSMAATEGLPGASNPT